jgi:hypothetical protein
MYLAFAMAAGLVGFDAALRALARTESSQRQAWHSHRAAREPAAHRANLGIYAVIDQQIWRPPTGEADKGAGVFARASASPADRDLIDLYFDGGTIFAGLIPGRPDVTAY